MCIAFLLWDCLPHHSLILAFNRDEKLDRETLSAHWWNDKPEGVVGGRDCVGKGSWLVASVNGRVALLTNVRNETSLHQASTLSKQLQSRGALPVAFVESEDSETFIASLQDTSCQYPGFNLIIGDLANSNRSKQMHYITNSPESAENDTADSTAPASAIFSQPIFPGIHGLSNASLDTPWPKIAIGRRKFDELAGAGVFDDVDCPFEAIFQIMSDPTKLAEVSTPENLPRDTGYGDEFEASVSGIFVKPIAYDGSTFGTRSMTVLAVKRNGQAELRERWLTGEGAWAEERHSFEMRVAPSHAPSN